MGIADIISLLGGLAFFLFGMTLLGEGLKRVAGSRLETILSRLTSNRIKGVLLGAGVTAVIQSSSATSVMVVGFVNSGIMKLTNAIGIIMGANIGTTATGWILTLAGVEGSGGFSSATVFAFIAFIGIILYFFCRKPVKKNVGMILLAFSVLMNGMQTMSSAMAPLKTSEPFLNFISAVSNPAAAILVGLVFTAIIQSNSAAVGILQALAVTGAINFDTAVPLVIGMNIGACAPVLLSAIGANRNGKRTAIIYLIYNFLGAIPFMILLYGANAVVGVPFFGQTISSVGVAVINTVFNVVATVILTPFISQMEKLTYVIFPAVEEDDEYEENLLDERFLDYPPLAVEQSGKTMDRMTVAAFKNLNKSIDLIHSFNREKYEKVMSRENTVDRYEDRLGAYLVRLNAKELSEKETQETAKYLNCLTNVERISDHAVNLADLAQEMSEKKVSFSPQAEKELNVCIDAVREIASLAQTALTDNDLDMARRVEPLEEVIDMVTEELKVRHINRLQNGRCTLKMGFIFNDCINNFERVADHCSNIAVAVLEGADSALQSHDYLRGIKQNKDEEYRRWTSTFEKKYCEALLTGAEEK